MITSFRSLLFFFLLTFSCMGTNASSEDIDALTMDGRERQIIEDFFGINEDLVNLKVIAPLCETRLEVGDIIRVESLPARRRSKRKPHIVYTARIVRDPQEPANYGVAEVLNTKDSQALRFLWDRSGRVFGPCVFPKKVQKMEPADENLSDYLQREGWSVRVVRAVRATEEEKMTEKIQERAAHIGERIGKVAEKAKEGIEHGAQKVGKVAKKVAHKAKQAGHEMKEGIKHGVQKTGRGLEKVGEKIENAAS